MDTKGYKSALATVTILFFMWGFLTELNDILVPHLKVVFDLSYTESSLIQFFFFLAYFIMAIPAGKVIARFGYRRGIVLGLCVGSAGAFMFYPAAAILSYPLFLTALFILATGITLLQVAANPYVSVLGKPATASSRLNLTQAVNSVGHTLAPKIGALLILVGAVKAADELGAMSAVDRLAYKLESAASVQGPYLGLAVTLFVLAVVMAFIKLPVISTVENPDTKNASLRDALKHRHLRWAAVSIFIYVGAEVSIGTFLVNFFVENNPSLTRAAAGGFVSYYWGAAMVGRFIGSALLQRLKPRQVLIAAAAGAFALVAITILTSGPVAMWTIIAVGLFNSVMFPIIFTLGIEGLGNLTSRGSSVLVMAIVGGAAISLCVGVLSDLFKAVHFAFALPALCYAYLVFYALKSSKHPAILEPASLRVPDRIRSN